MTDKMDENLENQRKERVSAMSYSKADFAKIIMSDLSKSREGRQVLKKYKQSEVREIIENYTQERNQPKLREISKILYARSPQYQRLINYFSSMALFAQVVTPVKDLRKLNKTKVLKQFTEISELAKQMNLRHEMNKVLSTAFTEDVFYGYIHRDKNSFYIQHVSADICKITSVEDSIYNYSIDMSYFQKREDLLDAWADEVRVKYFAWKAAKERNPRISQWVELDAKNTICIKVNEHMLDIFPPFAGSFDSIFDIEGFKQLRKDKEELGNYMMLAMELPIRKDSEDNNDFMIDLDMMRYFHNLAVDSVPENVGVITSPMPLSPIKFDRDRLDSDGVGKATRDLWESFGSSQLLFSADKSTSEGLKASIRTDEQLVFSVLDQIQRWLNRYLRYQFNDLMFNVNILHITHANRESMFKMYLEVAQYGVPVKSHIAAAVGLDPIETMNMAYLENDLLKMNEEFVPLQSSHTMKNEEAGKPNGEDGRPKTNTPSDETVRDRDKPNGTGT